MKNKILLFSPSQKRLYAGKVPYPPLGLLYLSSVLKREGFRTELVQEDFLGKRELIERLTQNEVLAVFATCTTPLFKNIRRIGRILAQNNGPSIILGGPHATSYGKTALAEGVLAVVKGEGEYSAVKTAVLLSKNQSIDRVEGVTTRNRENPASDFIEDLDSIPFPDYGLVRDWKLFNPPESRQTPAVPVSFSRGCTGNCIFCSTPTVWGRKVRRMSPERAMHLIEYIHKQIKAKEIHITDDDFTGDREWTENFLFMLRKKRLPLKFYFMNGLRPSNIDEDMLEQMKRSNFVNAGFGIETASDEIYRNIGKAVEMKKYEDAVRLCAEKGFTTWIFYIFGLPCETRETVEESIRGAKASKAHFAKFFILQPYKGTRIHEIYHKKGFLSKGISEKSLYDAPDLDLPGLSRGEMKKLLKKAYLKFYLNPGKLLNITGKTFCFSSKSFLSDVKFVLRMIGL
ncbi:B12-binding domain-containing radical SAM protein [candidate division WOR-3 bacterium]|nr:B12-binding domain-containing radical SAM protein [candidate division WOR-3 bacterium]